VKLYWLAFMAAVLLGIGFGTVANVSADKPGPPVGAHRHFFLDPNGNKVYVGPNFCEISASDQGFYGFHWEVHVKDPGLVNVDSEGCPS
jgi:hypothetical protein